MSDFDANPFADPEAANPFGDQSIRQATGGGQSQNTGGLDDYNPFQDNQTNNYGGQQTTTKAAATMPPPQPAVMQATQEQPPPYTPSAAQLATEDLQRKQEELERKAAELARKEQEMQRNMNAGEKKNNFPPLPAKCCVQPCFYQDFSVDIPLEFQKIVKIVYYLWLAYSCILFLNVIGCIAYFAVTTADASITNQSGFSLGFSIMFFVLFTPCSFVCWFRPAYKAFRSDSSFNFFVFFFIFFFQFCVCILQCLGIDGWGTCGWINAMGIIGANIGAGIIMFIIAALFSVIAVIDMVVLIRVHRIYRNTGASFEKAQQEFASGVMSNRTVQNAAGNAAATAARSAMNNEGNRY